MTDVTSTCAQRSVNSVGDRRSLPWIWSKASRTPPLLREGKSYFVAQVGQFVCVLWFISALDRPERIFCHVSAPKQAQKRPRECRMAAIAHATVCRLAKHELRASEWGGDTWNRKIVSLPTRGLFLRSCSYWGVQLGRPRLPLCWHLGDLSRDCTADVTTRLDCEIGKVFGMRVLQEVQAWPVCYDKLSPSRRRIRWPWLRPTWNGHSEFAPVRRCWRLGVSICQVNIERASRLLRVWNLICHLWTTLHQLVCKACRRFSFPFFHYLIIFSPAQAPRSVPRFVVRFCLRKFSHNVIVSLFQQ